MPIVFYAVMVVLILSVIKYNDMNKLKGEVVMMWYIAIIVIAGIVLSIVKYVN